MASLMTDAAWTRDEKQPEISPEFFGCDVEDLMAWNSQQTLTSRWKMDGAQEFPEMYQRLQETALWLPPSGLRNRLKTRKC